NPRVAILAAMAVSIVFAQPPNATDHWVTTWGASPQARLAAPPRPANAQAPTAPNAPAAPAPPVQVTSLNNQTLRLIVHTTIGGRRLRVHLSNDFGLAPLKIGAAHVALRSKGSAVVEGSDRALSFNGQSSCTIPAGAQMISDPVDLELPPAADVA